MAYALPIYDEPDEELVKMDAYEEDIWQEAMDAFREAAPWDHEDWAKSVAYMVLEGYAPAVKIFRSMGLNRRHAYILVGHTKEFWQDVNDDFPAYDGD